MNIFIPLEERERVRRFSLDDFCHGNAYLIRCRNMSPSTEWWVADDKSFDKHYKRAGVEIVLVYFKGEEMR